MATNWNIFKELTSTIEAWHSEKYASQKGNAYFEPERRQMMNLTLKGFWHSSCITFIDNWNLIKFLKMSKMWNAELYET